MAERLGMWPGQPSALVLTKRVISVQVIESLLASVSLSVNWGHWCLSHSLIGRVKIEYF